MGALHDVLRSSGFTHIYEWRDEPHTEYAEHSHKGRVTIIVTEGSVTFSGGFQKTVVAGKRFDVPVGVAHTAQAGLHGCTYVVGEEIEGDS